MTTAASVTRVLALIPHTVKLVEPVADIGPFGSKDFTCKMTT